MHKSLECLQPGRPGHPLHSPLELRERLILFKVLGMVWKTLLYLTYTKATGKGYKATNIIWTFLGDILKLSPNSTPKMQTYALIPFKRRNKEASRRHQREAGSMSSFLGPEDGLHGHHKQVKMPVNYRISLHPCQARTPGLAHSTHTTQGSFLLPILKPLNTWCYGFLPL